MTSSMTGFASVRQSTPWGNLSVEIRSLNHRYLETFVRLPEELRFAEPAIRERIGSSVKRGKVEVTVRLKASESADTAVQLTLNTSLAGQLAKAADAAKGYFPDAAPARLSDWLSWPGMVASAEADYAELGKQLDRAMESAVIELNAFRGREGAKLAAVIEERLEGVEALAATLKGQLPEIRSHQQTRLEERLAALTETALDPGRLEQELVIILQKLDVDEELDRLGAHISEVRRTLGQNKPKGRRLDFLMQEFNREANTLGSKSVSETMSRTAVDMKVLIEQMREQIQNIE